MMREQVEAALAQWSIGFNEQQTRRVATHSVAALRPRSANEVLEHVKHVVRGTPQVMVRISGGGRGMARIRAHLDYIARHGQLPLEDQDGEHHLGKHDLAWLAYGWQCGGVPIPEQATRREALNIVLSMPTGTDAPALLQAAREFAAAEFAGHQYVMALHTPEGDPGRNKAPQPHVHLCVKIADNDGRRLNPRKQDLRRWRESFAGQLRTHGIDAAASSRLERFQPQRGLRQAIRHLRARDVGEAVAAAPIWDSDRATRAQVQEQHMADRYAALGQLLLASGDPELRTLVRALEQLREPAIALDRSPGRRR